MSDSDTPAAVPPSLERNPERDCRAIGLLLSGGLDEFQKKVVMARMAADTEFRALALVLGKAWVRGAEKGRTIARRPTLVRRLAGWSAAAVLIVPIVIGGYIAYASLVTVGAQPLLPIIDFADPMASPSPSRPIDPEGDRMQAEDDSARLRALARNAAAESAVAQGRGIGAAPPGATFRRAPGTFAATARRVGPIPPLIENGYRVRTGRNESVQLPLPDGATLTLYPESQFTFGGDSARVMQGVLFGEAVLEIPRGWWQLLTAGAAFNLGAGRYAVRNWQREDAAEISIDRGRVYAFGDSVVGRGVFALVKDDSTKTLQRVEDGKGFLVLPHTPGRAAPPKTTAATTDNPSAPAAAPRPVDQLALDTRSGSDRLRDTGFVARIPGVRSTSKVRPVGDLRPIIMNGFRADAWSGETVDVDLPGGAKILLRSKTNVVFSGNSSPTMNALLNGEAVLEVPPGVTWKLHTLGGEFSVGPGRYAIRTGKLEDGVRISIERGKVEAFGASVEGTGVFALANAEAKTVLRVEDGTGFPILTPERRP